MVVCLACAAPSPQTRCTGCYIARFCCKACQRSAWREHRPFCGGNGEVCYLSADDILEDWREQCGQGRATAAGSSAPGTAHEREREREHELESRRDAEIQAEVLHVLGLHAGAGPPLGQRPLGGDELWAHLASGRSGLAPLLFGRSAFESSLRPLLRALTVEHRWPSVMSVRPLGHVTELPSLELCAALVTRILCAARRLREAGHRRLIVLGLGSGDALVEACVVLHVAAALGSSVDLRAAPPLRIQFGALELQFVATDCPELEERHRNCVSEAPPEMRVLPLDRREAVRTFAAQGFLYVLSAWMPMRSAGWRAGVEEDAGARLAELCFLTVPPRLIEIHPAELQSAARETFQLFPKTLCRWDFLAREPWGEEGGFFHSQLFVLPSPGSPPPFLAAPLRHMLGNYASRLDEDAALKGVNLLRAFGLHHVHGPEDFGRAVPEMSLLGLREAVGAGQLAIRASSAEEQLRQCLTFLSGPAHSQVSALLRELARIGRAR
mmetsp:Transcript_70761/g.229907  ORF Transcript_70761/g.229907 Transcript_70761/m.229907 type:complete len:496 (-) Transcript_70761:9-1496(-)